MFWVVHNDKPGNVESINSECAFTKAMQQLNELGSRNITVALHNSSHSDDRSTGGFVCTLCFVDRENPIRLSK